MAETKGKRENKRPPGAARRLRQLVVCVLLFLLVFLGRGTDLGPVTQLSQFVTRMVQTDTDFQAVFSAVGESFSRGAPAAETFRALLPSNQEGGADE